MYISNDYLNRVQAAQIYGIYKSLNCNCYIQFKGKHLLNDVRECLLSIFPDCKLDLQSVKSRRNVVGYISKEDVNLLTNIKSSDLNFNYQIFKWAESTKYFDPTHWFVVTHRHYYKFLERYLQAYQMNQLKNFTGLRKYSGLCRTFWLRDIVYWWNEWVDILDSKLVVKKRKQLYLHGDTNVGKSTVIEKLIGKNNMKFCFYPGVGKFCMQGFNQYVHKVIIFEEFNVEFYPLNMLKRLLEGRDYAYPVKCCPDQVFKFVGPVIFVSNSGIETVKDNAFLSRLQVVFAGRFVEDTNVATAPSRGP